MKTIFSVFIILTFVAFSRNQSNDVNIDWDDLYESSLINGERILTKLPFRKIEENYHRRVARIIGGEEVT